MPSFLLRQQTAVEVTSYGQGVGRVQAPQYDSETNSLVNVADQACSSLCSLVPRTEEEQEEEQQQQYMG